MKTISKGLLYFFALGISGYVAFVYGFLPLGSLVHPDMKGSFLAHPYGIYIHAFASIVALAIGPFQFSSRLRENRPNLHRWLGRSYLAIGVMVGGFAGLYMSQYAFGGTVARVGFAFLAVLWIYTGLRAYIAIRRGLIHEHRKWMIRNYSLTFAAVTLRLYLPISMVGGIDFAIAYPVIAWLCWVPNLVFAEWWFNSKNKIRPQVR
ncbi:MAG: DUF2306 domain-containing protein [Gammaproteobacteria bacterium]|nr:DUF2306 domain-containing protein [Gammaproteobacteria bacterium]